MSQLDDAGQADDTNLVTLPKVSGLYARNNSRFPRLSTDELRLDVDGSFPQMAASGTTRVGLTTRIHWIAKLVAERINCWKGAILFKDGAVAQFPYSDVLIEVQRAPLGGALIAAVTFSSASGTTHTIQLQRTSTFFRAVEFEYDAVAGTQPVTAIQTNAHPNRPATLPAERLSIERVYERSGFRVSVSGGSGTIPISAAGSNATWSDQEMHDAMRAYWTRFADRAQWSLWVLFAHLHDQGSSLGGVMFDDIGPNHRQGTAIFNGSFIATPPTGDPAQAAWVERMKFWTAVHEMGHAFNLAHSWQKALGAPWIPLPNEPEARSFMNYPYNVAGGQTAFFSNFEFRFSDSELLFLRHAPERFVQMGNAAWFDHHGFEQAEINPESSLSLQLRANRNAPIFEFLEPVVLELKLTNVSPNPEIIRTNVLSDGDHLTVIVKKIGSEARQLLPYAHHCRQTRREVLSPGESRYESLFVSAGKGGWVVTEPGNYSAQVLLHLDGEDIVSNAFHFRVLPPKHRNPSVLRGGPGVARVLWAQAG